MQKPPLLDGHSSLLMPCCWTDWRKMLDSFEDYEGFAEQYGH